ncbi:MAG: acyl-CoA dehydrogenase family protein [Parvularculales bacterium]
MSPFNFDLHHLPPKAEKMRAEVRSFLDEWGLQKTPLAVRAETWMGYDADFSRAMGEQGWIGMCWPKKYGGHERSAFERYVVLEEMLAAGAPVGAHWVADRQSGPLLLRFGSEHQRQTLMPAIAKGELFFSIGMSEPDSGSDLASVRTRATPVEGGYEVTGTKLWSSNAHRTHYMIALVRTAHDEDNRHAGLTQLLIDLSSSGITIRPITDLAGQTHFNEVVFEEAFVPSANVIGKEGEGWDQVRAELAYERSGPERYLSSALLLAEMVRRYADKGQGNVADTEAAALGRQIAHMATLRHMSVSVAGMLESGQKPDLEAAVVKDLGAVFEQQLPQFAHDMMPVEPLPGVQDDLNFNNENEYAQALGYLTQVTPSFSLRGGTREILRGIIARGLGLR